MEKLHKSTVNESTAYKCTVDKDAVCSHTGNIILIGFMGCGKTTFGGWIEKNYARPLIDTDSIIVLEQHKAVNDIFAEHGEAYFRNLETDCIRKLIADEVHDTVISVGGGLPISEQNGELLRELGTVVYLRARVDTLVRRLSHDNTRPLLAGGNIEERINELMGKRAGIYMKRADLIIDTDDISFENMYERIVRYENTGN